MMADKVKMLGLLFDNDQGKAYSSGEVVSGHVLIDLAAPTEIKAVKLYASGYGQVHWVDESRYQPSIGLNIPTPYLSSCAEEREYLYLSKTLIEATGRYCMLL